MIRVRILGSEELYKEWQKIGCVPDVLGNIFQNEGVELDENQLVEWKLAVEQFQHDFNELYERSLEHIVSCKLNEEDTQPWN